MFNSKTLIIVGAGASEEAKLPTGKELKERIAGTLNIELDEWGRLSGPDNTICKALEKVIIRKNDVDANYSPPQLRYVYAAQKIRGAMPLAISIDNFIDTHQGDKAIELCGKLAIVCNILDAERQSLLFVNRTSSRSQIDYSALEDTWFNSFMKLLTENCTVDHLEERLSSIKVVIFNYDRCIEHFLFNALQTYYGMNSARAAALVDGIKIYHPYGTVGGLSWSKNKPTIDFGATPNVDQLIDLAAQIKTFTEGTEPHSSHLKEIRTGMTEARIVLFLGFAFHRLNLDLIQSSQGQHLMPQKVQYLGTAKGISESDCKIISSDLTRLGGASLDNITLRNDLTCSKFFSEYWRNLALS